MERRCLYCGCTYSSNLSSCPNCGGGLTAETYHMDTDDEKEEGVMDLVADKLKELLADKRVLAVLLVVAIAISGVSLSKRITRFKETITAQNSENQVDNRTNAGSGDSRGTPTANTGDSHAMPVETTPTPTPVDQNYELGMAYLEHGDYEKAIRTLNQVSSASNEYADAQIAMLSAADYYRADALAKAVVFNQEGNYEASINLLRKAEDLTGFSAEVTMQRESAEEAYFNAVVEECKSVYTSEGADSASDIVAGALAVLKDDSRLLNLKALFDSVTTVPERQMTNSYSHATTYDYITDSYGNEHDGCLLMFRDAGGVEYTPFEKYDTFSANIFVGEMYEDQRIQLKFYCDEKLVYETGMVDRQYRGEKVNIDITGVYSFRIAAEGVGDYILGSYHPNIWLEDATFSTGFTEADIDKAIQ